MSRWARIAVLIMFAAAGAALAIGVANLDRPTAKQVAHAVAQTASTPLEPAAATAPPAAAKPEQPAVAPAVAKVAPAVVSPASQPAQPTPKASPPQATTIKEALAGPAARGPQESALAVVAEPIAPSAKCHSEPSLPRSVLAIRTNELTKVPAAPSTPNPPAALLTRPIVVDTAPAIEQQVAPRRVSAPQPPAGNASAQSQSPAPDEMAALRQLLAAAAAGNAAAQPPDKTDGNANPADKPAVAAKPGAAPAHARPKITRVGEGDDHLTLDFQDADIRDVLEMISEEGRLNILPSNSVKGKVSASLHDVDLETALSAILKSTGYVTRRHGNSSTSARAGLPEPRAIARPRGNAPLSHKLRSGRGLAGADHAAAYPRRRRD